MDSTLTQLVSQLYAQDQQMTRMATRIQQLEAQLAAKPPIAARSRHFLSRLRGRKPGGA